MLKRIVSGIMLTMLLASMLTLAFSIHSTEKSGIISNVADGLADFGGESGGFEAQSGSVDWWPMFHHDLNHMGYSTSTAPKTNRILWSYTTGSYVDSSPAVADGFVYVGSGNNNVYALNATTRAVLWSYHTSDVVDSSPAVADGFVYVGSWDDYVYALNATTGTLVWSYKTGGPIVHSSPAVADGVVYVGSEDFKVYALNATTGTPVWNYTTGGVVDSSPAVAGGVVFVGSNDDKVYAINATTGAPVWNYTTGSPMWYSSPAVADGNIYVGSRDGTVYALTTTGTLVWSYKTGAGSYSSPTVAGGIVFVGSRDNKVYAINATTGNKTWSYTTGGVVDSSPTVADGFVFVGSDDNKVYAFGVLPLFVTISPSSVVMDVGQSQLFTSNVTGGTPLYTYQWYLNHAPVSGATSNSWNFTPTSSGSYTVYLNVTDSVGVIAISPASNVTVNTQLTVTISPNVAAIYWGQSQIFNSSVSGGTSPYSYQWYRNGTLVSGATNSTWTFTPSAAGYHTIYVKVTDNASTPFTVQSGNAQLTVNPSPAWPMFRNDSTHIGYSTSTAPTTNKTLWSNQTKGWVRSSPAVAGGVVYVGSYDKNVYALNATTGTPVWNYTTGGAVESSPAVAGGVVFVGSDNGYVYALNATTGAPMWNYTTPTHGVVDSSPAVAGGVVFVGTNNGYVYALNATTGAPVWSRKICPSIVHSSPAVAGGFVFVGSTDSNVYALDAATGTVRWKYLTGAAVYSSPAVVGGVVYVGSADYYVYALLNAANSASVEWKYKTKNVVYSSPAVAGGVVFVGSWDNKTYALNASSGALIWSYTTGDAVESSPAVADGVVYVGSADGKVYALDAATGTLVWSYTTDGVVVSSPAVAGGVVYVGSDDYNVYAIGLSPSPDVAVTGVMSSKTVGQGFSTSISVTVANQDNRAETFKVTAYANAIPIASQNVTLSSGTSATITFAWNTSGFAKGNCTISAYATPVTDETDIINNNCTDCSVLITKVGDLGSRVLVSPGPPPVYANEFFVCDGAVTSTDLNLFLQCYKATAPTDAMYLGDLGSRVVVGGSYANVFFVRDGKVTSTDLNLFLQCYKGQGPPDP